MIQPDRYPIEPLAAALGITWTQNGHRTHRRTNGWEPDTEDGILTIIDLARILGCSVRTVYNLRNRGLTSRQADRYAVHHAGKHPAQIWPAWFNQQHVNADIGDLEPVDMHDPTVNHVQPTSCTS